jgi:hypothetical protein
MDMVDIAGKCFAVLYGQHILSLALHRMESPEKHSSCLSRMSGNTLSRKCAVGSIPFSQWRDLFFDLSGIYEQVEQSKFRDPPYCHCNSLVLADILCKIDFKVVTTLNTAT